MRVIAIDPGYERLGIAVVEKNQGEKEVLVYSTCYRTLSSLDFTERLYLIGKEIERVITEYSPNVLALEGLFFSKNQKTALKVSEARGVIQYQAKRQSLEIFEFRPQEIKIAITSSGSSTKEQMIGMIPRLIDLSQINNTKTLDDEFDAIAIGLTYFAHNKQ